MPSKQATIQHVGLVIAYVLPGLTALWGGSYFSETLRAWVAASPTDAPTVAGFLYRTLASIAAGLTVSTVRWLLMDRLHHWIGIPEPRCDFSRLQDHLGAFDLFLEIHYRYYYQFYSSCGVPH